jgi:hypothetical protein
MTKEKLILINYLSKHPPKAGSYLCKVQAKKVTQIKTTMSLVEKLPERSNSVIHEQEPVVIEKQETKSSSISEPIEYSDYSSHSIIICRAQLDLLQQKVLMRKIQGDRKYSMKMAFNEALTLWQQNDIPKLHSVPDDFVTYSSLFSETQLSDALDRIYLYKAKVERGYSLKRALYEAVELYLNSILRLMSKYIYNFTML